MHNKHNVESADIWRAAQRRRTEDIAGWLGQSLERQRRADADKATPLPKLGFSLARSIAVAIIALVAITSVSAVVQAKKSSHVRLTATGLMPAVNVP
jgi:hypothetical protein